MRKCHDLKIIHGLRCLWAIQSQFLLDLLSLKCLGLMMFVLTADVHFTPCLEHAHTVVIVKVDLIVYVCFHVFVNLLIIANVETHNWKLFYGLVLYNSSPRIYWAATSKSYWCFWRIEEICGVSGTFVFMRTRRTATLQPFWIQNFHWRLSHVYVKNGNRMRTRMECWILTKFSEETWYRISSKNSALLII